MTRVLGSRAAPSEQRLIRLPAWMDPNSTRGWLAMLGAGAGLGAVTLIVPVLLDDRDAFGFLAILLGMIAGVYLGFALQDGRIRAFNAEYVGIAAHAVLATVALASGSAVVLAAGYLAHAAWDAIHHPRAIDTLVPPGYVPACIGYDVVVALYVLIRF